MSLNHREIDAVLAEIPLIGSHIQKIVQPDFKTLVFHLYRPKNRYRLLISLNQGKTRLHLLTGPVEKTAGLQRFAQLLRARIQGGRITEAGQAGADRIVKIYISKGEYDTILWIRLWGGAANILATDTDGRILDVFYRRPKRNEISGAIFSPPDLESRSGRPGEFEIRPFSGQGTLNERIERYYTDLETGEELNTLKARALKAAEEALRSAESLHRNILRRISEYESYEEMREYGDLVKSNLYRIHRGDRWLEAENFYRNGLPVRIELDRELSPEENAEKYYKKYKKAKRGIQTLSEELESAGAGVGRARAILEEIRSGSDTIALKDYLSGRKTERQSVRSDDIPGLQYYSGGFIIRVGRSSKENDYLLRKWSRGNDIWMHARDWPGAYVFIRTQKDKSVPLDVLLDAGNLALHYSRGKASGRGDLYYTRVKYLRRAKEDKPGLVLPTMEKNLSIVLEEKRLARLFGGGNIALPGTM